MVRDLKAPLAVLHGAAEQLVNGGYFASLAMPTLWRGAVQIDPRRRAHAAVGDAWRP